MDLVQGRVRHGGRNAGGEIAVESGMVGNCWKRSEGQQGRRAETKQTESRTGKREFGQKKENRTTCCQYVGAIERLWLCARAGAIAVELTMLGFSFLHVVWPRRSEFRIKFPQLINNSPP